MKKRLLALFAGVLAIGLIVAGCGGDSDDSSTATVSSLTKADFIAKADAICQESDKAISEEAEKFAKENDVDTSDPSKEQQEEVIVDVLAPNTRAQAEEIRELGVPEGDEEEVEAILQAVEAGADAIEDDPGALLEEQGNPLALASKLARAYGFEACGT